MMELKEPKRKRCNKALQTQPLPVVIESISGITACNGLWPTYIGTFSGDSVIVSARDEMTALYNMGFFGRGCLSRGFPNFGEVKKGKIPLITERQWKRRKLWMDQVLSFTDSSCTEELREHDRKRSKVTTDQKTSKESTSTTIDPDVIEIIDTAVSQSDNASSNKKTLSKTRNESVSSKRTNDRASSLDDPVFNKPITSKEKASDKDKHDSEASRKNGSAKSSVSLISDTLDSSEKEISSRISRSEDHALNRNESNCVVVIDDIVSDDEYQPESLKPRLHDEPIKTAVETLNLMLEEAFFLSFGLGCLQVVDLHGNFLPLQDMWLLYKESQLNFISNYVTYHYFRSKGWIVKPGTKFGGNFLLYKEGPPFYHASYIVLVEDAKNDQLHSQKRHMSWTKLLGINRTAESANKEVLLSQVVWPSHVTKEELNDPRIISKFKVQEVLLRRWNSGQEREVGKDA